MNVTPPSLPADSDLQLVERTVAGDQRAYELLVIKYQRRIERLIGRMVRDTDLVQDIAQETFIRAYRALHQFRGCPVLYLALPHCCEHRQKGVDGHETQSGHLRERPQRRRR